MSSAIDQAIAAAVAAAQSAPQVPATTAQAGVPAAAPARGTPLTLADFSVGSMVVEDWLKVKAFGLLVGTNSDLIKSIDVMIDPTQIQVCNAIKFGNNPTIYLKTYDEVSCTTGGTWPAAVARAQAADPKARPYKSADIPMTLLNDIVVADGKSTKVLVEAGKILGHSLSTTNRGHFQIFLKELADAGLLTSPVVVTLGYEHKKKGTNEWGLVTFKLVGAYEAEETADAA